MRNKVRIKVEDQGVGITPSDLKYIMDPFFTTKRDVGGTGLGLSVSYNIVKSHSGSLNFESTPGKGTVARISFSPHEISVPGAIV
jgi:polar amino acid transport system substrate-binding protein